MKNDIIASTNSFQALLETERNPHVIQTTHHQLTELNKKYRELLLVRRTSVFDELMEDLGQPQNMGSFLRMVKCMRARKEAKGCKLDPTEIDTHAIHFKSTFGLDPTGLESEFEPIDFDQVPHNHYMISPERVQMAMRNLKLGKAAGVDGLMGEFFVYGESEMLRMLATLFNKVEVLEQIPRDWKEVMVVPIWKKKGSEHDVKNYRPISLSSICRKLYEKTLCMEIEPFVKQLSDYQGGFRHRRSTIDQVFTLHEIMVEKPHLHHVFLDLKAAYDMVDRRILWHNLHKTYGFPLSLVKRLAMMFDDNHSVLVINGHKSQPFDNKRGLLQGSSLSPILFNFFIDPLLKTLDTGPKVATTGSNTNHLFFADDGALHATSISDMTVLLKICEDWSRKVGMQFAPEKCIYLHENANDALKLYDVVLPAEPLFRYLGIQMRQSGIDWAANYALRAKKFKDTTIMLRKVGYNSTGFPLSTSSVVYKTFIRPTLTYGTELGGIDTTTTRLYIKEEGQALRTALSAPKNTSRNAMHKLLRVEPLGHRFQWTNAKYMAKLNNCTDSSIPAVKMFWDRLQTQPKHSLVTAVLKNPLWSKV